MRTGTHWLTLALVLLVISTLPAQQPVATTCSPETVGEIGTLIETLMANKGIPGMSVAVGVRNRLVYEAGFGLADVEHQVPATGQTRFRTASIAKSLTAVMVLTLVRDGQLDLDKTIQTYCPGYPEKQWPVTVRQVLGHLGGVRHYKSTKESNSTDHYFALNSALATFADDPLLHEPGTRYLYSSFGFNLLGSVAEGAGDATYMELLQRRVLDPAQMESTVADDEFAVIPNRAAGYFRPSQSQLAGFPAGNSLRANQLYRAPMHDTSMKIPGGGLRSTSSDLVRFASAVNQGDLLPTELLEAMWTSQQTNDHNPTGYGMGWRIGKQLDRPAVWHTGGQSGTSTVLLLFPDSGVSVSLMCNLQSISLTNLASAIANVVFQHEVTATPRLATRADAISQLKAAVKYEVEQKQLPACSIAVLQGDQIVWAEGFGFQDAEQRIPATANTVYRVGSISKLLTDISVMKLVNEGRLDLDTPIQNYLPDFKPKNPTDTPLTLRQLMTHRSGLVRESPAGHYFDPTEPTLSATVASLNQTSLTYPPDTKTKYSNAAIAVVGSVLESKLDGRHAELVDREIFQPLGMQHSSFVLTDAVDANLATAYMWTYDGRRFEAPRFLLGTGPAGNLYSTVTDLCEFVKFIFAEGRTDRGQVLDAATLSQMTTPQRDANGKPLDYGIGFHVEELDGHKLIGHGGAVYGFSTQLEVLPERKLGVVTAAALDGSNGVVRRLSHYALRLMLAVEDQQPLPEYPRTIPIPVARARELAGSYRQVDGDRVVHIEQLAGQVYLNGGTFRKQLRARVSDGEITVDDVFDFGTPFKRLAEDRIQIGTTTLQRVGQQPPPEIPARWTGLIGEYGWDHNTLYILERDGKLFALIEWFYYYPLTEVDENEYRFPDHGLYHGEGLKFKRDATGRATEVVAAEVTFARREVGTRNGETFTIKPVKPINELRDAAFKAHPPVEPGTFRESDLVELTTLEPGIRLDIRYATTNNFTGEKFYQQPRAFMQRPAAEAVARAHQRLKPHGLGLLIHDAYRPWHVTRMFWDATPSDMKDFVANPANGSRHNRGCAVDLTLCDLETGRPFQMVAGYDEFSNRSFPMYPGGTSRQRWYRTLLRDTMEAEGFSVYEFEWWHFDYQDWQKYRIGNRTFEQILAAER